MSGGYEDLNQPGETADTIETEPGLGLALAAFRLKDEQRGGWLLRHVAEPESVADHSWGTAMLCLLYAAAAGVDRASAVAMALVHDLAEAVTGDVVARANPADRDVSEAHKAILESTAIDSLLGAEFPDIRSGWQDYEDRSSPVALFVRDMNLVDMCLQALIYHQQHRYDAGHVVPSRGGFTHLDEFFASASPRLTTPIGRRLFDLVEARYLSLR